MLRQARARYALPVFASERSMVLLTLFAVYVVWGSTYLAMRFALQGFPPFIMAGLRFVVAGGALLLYLRARGAPLPTLKQSAAAVLVGALLLVGGNGGVALAEQRVSSGLAALGVATVPLWAVLFGGLWRRWPRRLEWGGLALGFAGIVLLNVQGDLRANPIGALTLLLAAASWALGSVWSGHLTLPEGMMGTAVEMLGAGVLLLLCGAVFGERIHGVPSVSSMSALLYLTVFGSLIAFSSYTYLLRHVPPTLATSYAYVNPLVAVGLGAALAGERVTLVELLAMPVILAGVVLVVLGRARA
jgi:drug/metabolite transporter (DMT)-like permease